MVARLSPALAVLAAACFSPNAPYGAPCATDTDCPSTQSCDPDTLTCSVETEALLWRDDTAADFGAAGAYVDEVTVEGAGFLGPIGYLGGGVRITGIDRKSVIDPSTSWDDAAAPPYTGTSLARGLALDFGSGAPPGAGHTKTDDITALFEGEILLDNAGTWRFELTANDDGFFELAPPGSRAFARVVSDSNNTTIASYQVTTPGWHRFRGAVGDANMNFRYELRYDRPGNPASFRSIAAADLRVPAADLAGLLVDGFANAYMIGPVASAVHPGTLDAQVLAKDPYGLPVGDANYTLRFAGQVLIDEEGSYTFQLSTSQGARMWLDGTALVTDFDTSPVEAVTDAVVLQPGWHDLVIDMHKTSGTTARIDLRATGGPWSGTPIPADHLRPVVGRGARWAAAASETTLTVSDGATATRTLSLEVPSGMTAARIDAAYKLAHPLRASVELVLDPPSGPNITLLSGESGSGEIYRRVMVPASSSGSSWAFAMTDTAADAMVGELSYAAVTIVGSGGGPAPFATQSRYISAPRDLGEIASLSSVRWGLRQTGSAGAAQVSLRTCDAPEACEAEPWTPVADGARPSAPARRFAQYMVELSGTGDLPTALDWIEIGYRAFAR